MFDLNILPSKEFDIPIISVGNITVGGTGKTPHVEYLISLLKSISDLMLIWPQKGTKSTKNKISGLLVPVGYSE